MTKNEVAKAWKRNIRQFKAEIKSLEKETEKTEVTEAIFKVMYKFLKYASNIVSDFENCDKELEE